METKYSPISLAPSYIVRGFSPLPLCAKGIPGYCGVPMSQWTRYCLQPATTMEFTRWASMDPGAGIALACGFNGLVAIDVDHVDGYPAVREVLGRLNAPTKIGSKGATAFFCDGGARLPSRAYRAKDRAGGTPGEVLIEVLAAGRCTTIPPTKHRKTGNPYRWHKASLEDLNCDQLPRITVDMIEQLENVLAPLMNPKRTPRPVSVNVQARDFGEMERRRYHSYARRALDVEVAKNVAAGKGARGRQLFESVCSLGRYVHHGFLDAATVGNALTEAAVLNGLSRANGPNDVRKTLERGFAFSAGDQLPELLGRPRPGFRRSA